MQPKNACQKSHIFRSQFKQTSECTLDTSQFEHVFLVQTKVEVGLILKSKLHQPLAWCALFGLSDEWGLLVGKHWLGTHFWKFNEII